MWRGLGQYIICYMNKVYFSGLSLTRDKKKCKCCSWQQKLEKFVDAVDEKKVTYY